MSKEGDILDTIITNMQGITPGNGYSFDVGANVFYWRDTPLLSSEFPCIIVRDVANNFVDDSELHHRLEVDVILIVTGATAPSDIRDKMQDVLTAFSLIRDEAEVIGATLTGIEKAAEQADFRFCAAAFQFTVEYYADLWQL